MANGTSMSFNTPNFSGLLFRKGKADTPFSTIIGAHPKYTNSVEFACGQAFNVEQGVQPSISENASLTAPTPKYVTREQMTNVTQIFQEAVSVSYGKMSNMGTMSGINVAGQQPNPLAELQFQIERRMEQIAQDIEYTFLNGVYNKATNDATANQSRGILTAITTNVLDVNNQPLNYWLVAEGLKCISDQGGRTDRLILGVNATTMLQLNKDATNNGMSIAPNSREENGFAIDTVVTPLGRIGLVLINTLPTGTALLFDPAVISPVFQEVPGKGNFFLEELSKVGAGDTYQIFGQAGLDHGPEFLAAKFTNISPYTPAEDGKTPSVTLDKAAASIGVGDTTSITATTVPSGQTVTWTSSDNSVATVSNGVVTGVAAGSATITASITVAGTSYTGTCAVTVA
jgi:uncharacterized protein YjdB